MKQTVEEKRARHREYMRTVWYPKNAAKQVRTVKTTRERLKADVIVLKNKPCLDCGIKYPSYVMDFDHVSDNKIRSISQLANQGARNKLLVEIRKCELVCANCHRVRTYMRQK